MFRAICKELRRYRRLINYLTFFIVGIGGLGLWIAWSQWGLGVGGVAAKDVLSNWGTLVISLAATTCADSQLDDRDGSGTKRLFILSLALTAVACGVCSLLLAQMAVNIAFYTAIAGSIIALLEWVLVNASNPLLYESDAAEALGGAVV